MPKDKLITKTAKKSINPLDSYRKKMKMNEKFKNNKEIFAKKQKFMKIAEQKQIEELIKNPQKFLSSNAETKLRYNPEQATHIDGDDNPFNMFQNQGTHGDDNMMSLSDMIVKGSSASMSQTSYFSNKIGLKNPNVAPSGLYQTKIHDQRPPHHQGSKQQQQQSKSSEVDPFMMVTMEEDYDPTSKSKLQKGQNINEIGKPFEPNKQGYPEFYKGTEQIPKQEPQIVKKEPSAIIVRESTVIKKKPENEANRMMLMPTVLQLKKKSGPDMQDSRVATNLNKAPSVTPNPNPSAALSDFFSEIQKLGN